MKTNLIIPLANWGVGTALIVVFAVVCIGLTAVVLTMIYGGKKKDDTNASDDTAA